MFTHPNLPTSTSAALIACNVTEASTTAASTIAKVAVTTSAQSISIINTSYVDYAMAAFQPSVVVLHARAAGRSAVLSAWVATIALASTSSSVPTSAHKLFSGPLNSESSRRSDTCVALFGMGEELISLTEHCSLLHLRQEHPHLLLHAQRQRGGSVVFPADPSSLTNSAAT